MVEGDKEGEEIPTSEVAGVPIIFCLKDQEPMGIDGIEVREVERRKFLFGTNTEEHQYLKYKCPKCRRYFFFDLTRGGRQGCFIATAAYGTPLADEINVLRRVRDSYLIHRWWGRKLVSTYYTLSPPVARVIEGSEPLKKMVRMWITPIVHLFREKNRN